MFLFGTSPCSSSGTTLVLFWDKGVGIIFREYVVGKKPLLKSFLLCAIIIFLRSNHFTALITLLFPSSVPLSNIFPSLVFVPLHICAIEILSLSFLNPKAHRYSHHLPGVLLRKRAFFSEIPRTVHLRSCLDKPFDPGFL